MMERQTGVMTRRHRAPAHDRGGEGLNLGLCTVLQSSERMIGMGGEGLNHCICIVLQTDARMPDLCDENV